MTEGNVNIHNALLTESQIYQSARDVNGINGSFITTYTPGSFITVCFPGAPGTTWQERRHNFAMRLWTGYKYTMSDKDQSITIMLKGGF